MGLQGEMRRQMAAVNPEAFACGQRTFWQHYGLDEMPDGDLLESLDCLGRVTEQALSAMRGLLTVLAA